MSTTESTFDDLPKRAVQRDVLSDNHFDIDGVYAIEEGKINRFLAEKANEHLARPNSTTELAKTLGPSDLDRVRQRFAVAQDRNVIAMAKYKEFAQHAPKNRSWFGWGFLFLLAFLGEIGIGIAMWLMQAGNAMVVLLAFVLAVGGLLLGDGLKGIVIRHELKPLADAWHTQVQTTSTLRICGEIAIGLAIIIGISWLRTSGERSGVAVVIGITAGLAVAIAVLEAITLYTRFNYMWLQGLMFKCQQLRATEQHRVACDDGIYLRRYNTNVDKFAQDYGKAVATHPQPSTTAPSVSA